MAGESGWGKTHSGIRVLCTLFFVVLFISIIVGAISDCG